MAADLLLPLAVCGFKVSNEVPFIEIRLGEMKVNSNESRFDWAIFVASRQDVRPLFIHRVTNRQTARSMSNRAQCLTGRRAG